MANPVLKSKKWVSFRIKTVLALLLILLLAVLSKAAFLQLFRGDSLKLLADRQSQRPVSYTSFRGKIYDRKGRLLAGSVPVESIFAKPRHMANLKAVKAQLRAALPSLELKALDKMSPQKAFVWLVRHADAAIVDKIRKLDIEGIGFIKEYRRFYPNGSLLGQTIGVLDIDANALSGAERAFDDYLRPRQWRGLSLIDAKGALVKMFIAPDLNELKGNDVYLTIDADLQNFVEEVLLNTVQKHGAKQGWAIVLEPKTGEILALANAPAFNPNHPEKMQANIRNQVLSRTLEPGSTFKTITFSAALHEKTANLHKPIFCENGRYNLGFMVIKDIIKKGWLSVADIFKYSSNIGTYKIATELGAQKLYEAIERFGFGQASGLNWAEEAIGQVSPYQKWGKTRFANISFGYGLKVTSLQMALAAAVIANKGVYTPAKLFLSAYTPQGVPLQSKIPAREPKSVLSKEAAEQITEMMVAETQTDGTGRQAFIQGIPVAGKTGTSEKVDEKTRRYDKKRNLSSFLGFAPAHQPEIVALIVIDESKGIAYGGHVAAPAWQQIVSFALLQRGIFPAETNKCILKSC